MKFRTDMAKAVQNIRIDVIGGLTVSIGKIIEGEIRSRKKPRKPKAKAKLRAKVGEKGGKRRSERKRQAVTANLAKANRARALRRIIKIKQKVHNNEYT